MSEDVIGKLARFSPTVPGLDRDELLFQAGRASATSGRWWRITAGVLAATQTVTLSLWLASTRPSPPIAAPGPEPAVEAADEPVEPLPKNSYLILSRFDPNDPAFPDAANEPGVAAPHHPLTAGWRGPID